MHTSVISVLAIVWRGKRRRGVLLLPLRSACVSWFAGGCVDSLGVLRPIRGHKRCHRTNDFSHEILLLRRSFHRPTATTAPAPVPPSLSSLLAFCEMLSFRISRKVARLLALSLSCASKEAESGSTHEQRLAASSAVARRGEGGRERMGQRGAEEPSWLHERAGGRTEGRRAESPPRIFFSSWK